MKKRKRIIPMILSLAMVFGLCGSEVTVHTVMAQEVQEETEDESYVQEVQEGAEDESQESEKTFEDVSGEEIMEDSGEEENKEKKPPEVPEPEKTETTQLTEGDETEGSEDKEESEEDPEELNNGELEAVPSMLSNARSEDVPDYDVWMADTVIFGINNQGNGVYPMFQSFQEPVYSELGGYLLEDEPLVSLSTTWSIFLNSEYRQQFANEQKYIYEVLLMNYLKFDADSKGTSVELDNNELKFSRKLYDLLVEYIDENKGQTITGMTVDDAIAYYDRVGALKQINTGIKELTDGVGSVKDLINVLSEYSSLQQVKEERVYLLKNARDACASSKNSNKDFIKAADELIKTIESSSLQYVQGKSLDYLWKEGFDLLWGKLCDANPVLEGLELGLSGLDVMFDSTNMTSNNLKLALLYTLDCYMEQGMMNAASEFMDNKTAENGQSFLACFQAYVQFQMYGNDYAKTWLGDYLDSGALSNVINMIFYRDNIKTAKELIERSDSQTKNRENILGLIDKYADIYRNTYQNSEWEEFMLNENIPVTGLSFSKSEETIAKKSLFVVLADVYPSNATNKNVTYVSSDPAVLSVPETGGFADVKKEGTVTITATSEDGGFTATKKVIIGEKNILSDVDHGICGDTMQWRLFDNGTLYIYGSGDMYDYDYQSEAPWRSKYKEIKTVIMSGNIIKIGTNAFSNCRYMENIDIPDSVGVIRESAFSNCEKLVKVTIPKGVVNISKETFYNCKNLTTVNIPDNVTNIDDNAFSGAGLTKIDIPNSVTIIKSGAFQNCVSLSEVILPENIKIGLWAFRNTGIKKLIIPPNISFHQGSFQDCKQLEEIITQSEIYINNSYLFDGCIGLKKVTLAEGVKTFPVGQFSECPNLKEVVLGKDIEKIDYTYYGGTTPMSSLTSVYVDKNNTNYVSENGVLYNKNMADMMYYPVGKKDISYTFPAGVQNVHQNVYDLSLPFKEVTIPDSMQCILNFSKIRCGIKYINFITHNAYFDRNRVLLSGNKIKEIELIDSPSEINAYAFSDLQMVEKVNIPDSVKSIGERAFIRCYKLKEIFIPRNVVKIDSTAFCYCTDLNRISVDDANKYFTVQDNILYDEQKKKIFLVSREKEEYTIPKSVISIESYAFGDCSKLKKIIIPRSVTEIGYGGFEDCKQLTIYCYKDSFIHKYAKEKGIAYILLDDTDDGCQKNLENSPKEGAQKKVQKVSQIKLSGISSKIAAGKKIKLTASVKPSNAANKKLIWKSSNKKVATVNSKGVVTMKKKSGGKSVTITATAKDGSKVKATYKITSMKGVVKKVAISGKKTVKAGKTLKLKAKVTATKKANKKLKWSSSNKKYATVSSSGKVKALKAEKGKKVKITAMATDGSGKKKTVTIKIK